MSTDPSTFGKLISSSEIVFIRTLPAPAERVWSYLTDADKRAKWFAGGEMERKVGGKLELHFDHKNLSGPGDVVPEKYAEMAENGAKMNAVITGYEPNRFLSYTWEEGEEPGTDSEVSFELEPLGDQTRLTLRHRKLPYRDALANVGGGWHTHLAILEALLEGRQPPLIWNTHSEMEPQYIEMVRKLE